VRAAIGLAATAAGFSMRVGAQVATRIPAAAPARALSGTQIVLLGTRAGPGVDLRRAQTATIILVDGTPYLIDCGYGAVRNMTAAGINSQQVSQVFFTHLHNDHTTDLPAFLSLQWTGGRTRQIDLYGPYGTSAMIRAVNDYLQADQGIRSVDEGREARVEDLYHGHDVEATTTPRIIFQDGRVSVSTVENSHYPEHSRSRMPHRSIAVRFDTKSRSVVISGDTSYSTNLVQLARNADVFVCEVMDQGTRDNWLAQLKQDPGAINRPSVTRHIAETHSTPEEVGRMATEANVKLVVLNHQLTNPGSSLPTAHLLEGVRKNYAGPVVAGEDLMMI